MDEAKAWRDWLLTLFPYIEWKDLAPGVEDPNELSDERLRALFAYAMGWTMGAMYRTVRSRVVRELAELEPK